MTVDQTTGTILYTTDEVNQSNVQAALEAMDVEKPQVLIKVVFLEVTYNNDLDVGIEGGLTHKLNGSQTLGVSNLFGLASQGIAPFTSYPGNPGAGFITLAGDNFSGTARFISEKGTAKVLSRPTILARTDQPAQIVIGQEVPLITGVNFGTLGQVTSVISYTSVGIILNVNPHIYPNGDVEMILNPQILRSRLWPVHLDLQRHQRQFQHSIYKHPFREHRRHHSQRPVSRHWRLDAGQQNHDR